MMRIGTVVSLPGAALAELAGTAFDLVWIDLEHGALGTRDAQEVAIGLAATGCSAHVRLPRWDSDALPAILDAGVEGVVAPRVDEPATAAALARRLRYPGAGSRGFGPRRAGAYGRAARWWEAAEAAVECSVQIETVAAVERAAEIAAVEGVDTLVVGCSDLSLELGAPQDFRDARLTAAVGAVRSAAHDAGKRFGVATGGSPASAASLAAAGDDLLVYSVDVRLYSAAVDQAAGALATALEGCHAAA